MVLTMLPLKGSDNSDRVLLMIQTADEILAFTEGIPLLNVKNVNFN